MSSRNSGHGLALDPSHYTAQKQSLVRRTLVGALVVFVYIASCPICRTLADANNGNASGIRLGSSSPDNDDALALPKKQYKVYNFGLPLLHLRNSSSATLVLAADGEEHDAEVIWSARAQSMTEVFAAPAAESMWTRLRRRGRIKSTDQTPGSFEEIKAILATFSQDELNEVDPGWKIFVLDQSDQGIGLWPYYFLEHELGPLVGWRRVNYALRATQTGRNLGAWVTDAIETQDPSLPIEGYLGTPENYTGYFHHSKPCFNSVQRLALFVREVFVDAIEEYMKEHHPEEYKKLAIDEGGMEDTNMQLSAAVARISRPMDVRNFWDPSWCNHQCAFRNRISEIVRTLPERHPNVTASTRVEGEIHQAGRHNLHRGYLDGMMTTKMIVLAQRDGYEDQLRF